MPSVTDHSASITTMPSVTDHSASESYSWTSESYSNPSDSSPSVPKLCSLSVDYAGPNAIPVIDLADPDALRLLSLACESWGAFQVIGHGIPPHVLENISTEGRRLFTLPTEEKMKIARAAGSLEGYGAIPLQVYYTKQFWAEAFTTKSKATTHQMASKLWLDGSTFCNAIEDYRKEMNSLSTKLVHMMLLSLGLTEADIKRADPVRISQKELDRMLLLNWYPACLEPEGEMGLAHHTDSGIIAMLYNTTTGLQVLKNEDQHGPARWVNVPHVPGSLNVIVGDLGHILSNGRFHNALHRAIVKQAEERLSVVYFWNPADNVMVSPLVTELTGKPVYRAVTWPEYAAVKHKMFFKAVDSMKLTQVEEDKKAGFASEVAEEKDGSASYLEMEKKDGSTASEVEEEEEDGSVVEVEEEKKDGSAFYLEEEKKVPEVEEEKKDGSPDSEMEEEVPNVDQEKKNGTTVSEMEEEKKNASVAELKEEEKQKDASPAGYV